MLAQAQSRVAKQLTSSGRLSNTGRESDVPNERQDFWRTVKVQQYVNVFEYVKLWLDIHVCENNSVLFTGSMNQFFAGSLSGLMSIPFHVQAVPI